MTRRLLRGAGMLSAGVVTVVLNLALLAGAVWVLVSMLRWLEVI